MSLQTAHTALHAQIMAGAGLVGVVLAMRAAGEIPAALVPMVDTLLADWDRCQREIQHAIAEAR